VHSTDASSLPSSGTSFSEENGFTANPLDQCVFNAQKGHHQCTVIIYVDDLMITCRDESAIDSIIESLSSRFDSKLKVTSGAIHSYLGMQFDFSLARSVKINMTGYTNDLLNFADHRIPAPDHLSSSK
jgi:hypothetical protein